MAHTTRSWNKLDREAAREGRAIKKSFHSVFHKIRTSKVTKNQAVWDELIEVHYAHCSYCGRPLLSLDNPNDDVPTTEKVIQDEAVCKGCRFLHQFMSRKRNSRKRRT